jgi:hypothetical protein
MKPYTPYYLITFVALSVMLGGCAGAEKSASMAFDNANGLVKSADKALWIDPEATPTAAPK